MAHLIMTMGSYFVNMTKSFPTYPKFLTGKNFVFLRFSLIRGNAELYVINRPVELF